MNKQAMLTMAIFFLMVPLALAQNIDRQAGELKPGGYAWQLWKELPRQLDWSAFQENLAKLNNFPNEERFFRLLKPGFIWIPVIKEVVAEADQASAELTAANTALAEKTKELAAVNDKLTQVQADLSVATQQNQNFSEQIAAGNQQIDDLQLKISSLQSEINTISAVNLLLEAKYQQAVKRSNFYFIALLIFAIGLMIVVWKKKRVKVGDLPKDQIIINIPDELMQKIAALEADKTEAVKREQSLLAENQLLKTENQALLQKLETDDMLPEVIIQEQEPQSNPIHLPPPPSSSPPPSDLRCSHLQFSGFRIGG